MKTIRATGRNIVLSPIRAKTETAAGLALPGVNDEGRVRYATNHGVIISVGPDATGFSVGQHVIASKMMTVEADGPDAGHCLICSAEFVVGIVEDVPPAATPNQPAD